MYNWWSPWKKGGTLELEIQFPIVPCSSVYNCILGRPFAATLDAITSHVHLNIKYHNIQDELDTKIVDLTGNKRIYQALQ